MSALQRFCDTIMHESIDAEEDFLVNLVTYILDLPAAERAALSLEASTMADLPSDARNERLNAIEFSWEIDEEVEFFTSIADIAAAA